jgi:hypothetical protein
MRGPTIARVHVRRALLLFALVLGLTALATAIAPPPPAGDDPPATAQPARAPVPPETQIDLPAPPPRGTALERRVKPGEHVVLQVSSAEGGEATVPKLGLTATVSGGAPARFDFLVPGAGRYDVLFSPALEAPQRVGTLVSR